MVAADHVLFDDTDYCLQMDDNDELDTIVMEDEDEAEVKEEDEEQELIIIPFKETCSKHIRGFQRHSCLYKYILICAWQQDSRQTCTSVNVVDFVSMCIYRNNYGLLVVLLFVSDVILF